MQSVKTNDLPENPRERANVISALCFWYTLPIFFKGRKKTLDTKDLYKALTVHKSETLGNDLSSLWEEELKRKSTSKSGPSLLRVTTRVFGCRFALLGLVLLVLELGLRALQPLFLLGLIAYYSQGGDNINTAYLYAAGVIFCSAVNVFIMHPYMLGTMHTGMKIRVAMCSMIYRKALRLSRTALGETTAGQVVNLISNDVGRLDLAMIFVHYLWIGPLETIFITYLMSIEIGVAASFGVAFMLLFIPLQGWLGKKTSVLRLRTALRTDERVRMMNEIISGIQVIKMYAWEIPFGKMVAYARKKEINAIRKVSYIRGVLLSFIMFLTRVSVFLSLVGYVLLQKVLTPEKAFVITAYYNILRSTMTVFFPQGISQVAEAIVSIKRIQKFMLYEETDIVDKSSDNPNYPGSNQSTVLKDDEKALNGNEIEKAFASNGHATLSEAGIILSNVKAKWDRNAAEYTLDNVNLRVQPGTLVAIIGPVGSGKSSVVQSILGELRPESGTIEVNGTFSYASQEPWLFTGTVRQNILFGQPMNRRRYQQVVKKCALERDFELLPYGDKTIVGERGASLSGGQKARISLARAVYRQTSIYLLDDPLSAVDTHVGRHLFDQCMRGFLRDHIVVLVTHQLQFLQQADQIVIMDRGRVSAVGTYDYLRESGLDFAKMLADPEKEEALEEKARSRSSSKVYSNRRNSEASLNSVTDSYIEDTPIQQQETQEQGKIGLDLYQKYFKAGGGFFTFFIMLFFCVLAQVLASGGDWFLSYWVAKKGRNEVENVNATIPYASFNDTTTLPPAAAVTKGSTFATMIRDAGWDVDADTLDIYIFTVITIATIVITLARSFLFFNVAMKASINLHNAMFRGITRAAMYFFNINPSGRILNRFSKDMGQVDEILPSVMMDVIQIFLSLFGIVIVIGIVNPLFLLPTAVLAVLFYYLRSFYLKTSRDVKRLEAITRSPIYSHMAASLAGLPTIRAFGAQRVLIWEFDNYQDMHSSAFYLFISTSRAFGYWLDCCCIAYIAIITLSFFLFPPENGGDVGLAITQAMGMTGMVQWGMRQSAELENTMTAVERIVEYEDIEPEGELESPADKKPPKTWPEEGKIVFDQLSLRYLPDPKAEYVLKSLNFVIKPCEKVGIVGRTGAGKSSLINALFRLSFNDGSIIIDSRDTKDMGLHDLRSKVSIIPQEPVLFSGTMRYNLDPFDEYSDAKLWEALQEVKLKHVVAELPSGLQSKISEGGANFSVGQRQLVCLARAILRENRILVLDEATANVDPQTDALIQMTIRNKFKNCTVLTIAHRLNTVMDSDKVLVMDAGQVVEFGSPHELLTQSEVKIFHGMVQQTGKSTAENLTRIAEKAHEQNLRPKME
ncbi:probable multidrug resistance-associated protein lethal(2)03659 [Anastrepha obliqua]|uniref:probable multidrug resistance-associated protein lethal(2)03659 n=1 Tax=Anastrepha obliqua TaxID=95512 RepID=UPI00240A55A4|nr:probable multidrug resistance-associated protein lethal(2)03659 [Anastrepha obliqua]XP_054726196.1 probable multidrug resistance-associated protein lethal(2)03659 [Anastrepha obliqua]XP_054726197.1 probable multidrug resistance-associated protein lethal(2)03659 [Anastrepha obliqua]XP_054726198.1 probable multidrug resistance-associated protein lethal(2)03659 [Anastrepha obliqua]XP_054726199.1 probable multidrug resistance-associated protein lethal(2)03659 [Anastrepha obliqua]XP_054726200.1 